MSEDRQPTAAEAVILIVDDELAVCELLTESFAERPWQVETAQNAAAALELCRRVKVDLVILDKNLPDMSGVKLFWRLRSEGHKVPCLMITGYASAESAVEMLNLGVSAYIEKPFDDIYQVGEKVAEILSQHRARTPRSVRSARAHQPAQQAARDRRALTVLVGSPVAAVRQGVAALLAGDAVHEVTSVAALEQQIGTGQDLDLVVLHASLSPTSSATLAATVRARLPAVALVVLARRPPVAVLKQLIEHEVDVLVEEPFDRGTFASAVSSLLVHLRQRRTEP